MLLRVEQDGWLRPFAMPTGHGGTPCVRDAGRRGAAAKTSEYLLTPALLGCTYAVAVQWAVALCLRTQLQRVDGRAWSRRVVYCRAGACMGHECGVWPGRGQNSVVIWQWALWMSCVVSECAQSALLDLKKL